MARFVQFVANQGQWEGRQLLKPEWFQQATSKQIENRGAGWGGDPDWQQGYGFQFWRCEPEGVFRGDGAFGQYGVVMTKQDMVIVIQSASMRLQAVLTAIWDKLLPQVSDVPPAREPPVSRTGPPAGKLGTQPHAWHAQPRCRGLPKRRGLHPRRPPPPP